MEDAKHYRRQADICEKIARQMSDRAAAASLRESAAAHLKRALELESKAESGPDKDDAG